jgi:hypothetical protein
MEWQAVVLAIQILLLAAGWVLFQRARGELSARAAETPVLAEVKALQQRVKQLLAELESATDRQAARLEGGCADAIAVLTEIEKKVRDAERLIAQVDERTHRADPARPMAAARNNGMLSENIEAQRGHNAVVESRAIPAESGADMIEDVDPGPVFTSRNDEVYAMADRGNSTLTIAHATRLSEGEVEMILALRGRR